MPRPSGWRIRVSEILTALRMLEQTHLERMHTSRSSACNAAQRFASWLRLFLQIGMAAGQVDRQRLIQWLESFEQEVTEEQERYQRVLQALRSVLPGLCGHPSWLAWGWRIWNGTRGESRSNSHDSHGRNAMMLTRER